MQSSPDWKHASCWSAQGLHMLSCRSDLPPWAMCSMGSQYCDSPSFRSLPLKASHFLCVLPPCVWLMSFIATWAHGPTRTLRLATAHTVHRIARDFALLLVAAPAAGTPTELGSVEWRDMATTAMEFLGEPEQALSRLSFHIQHNSLHALAKRATSAVVCTEGVGIDAHVP